MRESDTIKLLRECDAGIKMGITSFDDVLDNVKDKNLRKYITDCRNEHVKLQEKVQELLEKHHDDGKEPTPMAKGMSWVKINAKLVMNESDKTIADLMTEGCNMGIKSLNQFLNQYEEADEKTKDIARRLITLEERLVEDICPFL